MADVHRPRGERHDQGRAEEDRRPVDVSGGWFDAGDYLKFTETTSYAVAALEIAARQDAGSGGSAALDAEARHGLDWLDKMWDGATKTLYIQVGLGSGTEDGGVVGDHDVWRLPEQDDGDGADPFLQSRPVFRAGAPGARISPNQAGRLAADFALAAQRYAASDPARARGYLATAAQIYGLADTSPGKLVTTVPFDVLPGDQLAGRPCPRRRRTRPGRQGVEGPRAAGWLSKAATWAKGHQDGGRRGHPQHVRHQRARRPGPDPRDQGGGRNPSGLAVTTAQLKGYRAGADPHRAGTGRRPTCSTRARSTTTSTPTRTRWAWPPPPGCTGDDRRHRFNAFGCSQLDWVFGANAWGTAFMVGAGQSFPRCTAGRTRQPRREPGRHGGRWRWARWSTGPTDRGSSAAGSATSWTA